VSVPHESWNISPGLLVAVKVPLPLPMAAQVTPDKWAAHETLLAESPTHLNGRPTPIRIRTQTDLRLGPATGWT
jgi:hypothetical protein